MPKSDAKTVDDFIALLRRKIHEKELKLAELKGELKGIEFAIAEMKDQDSKPRKPPASTV